ncbi:MAG: DNA-protecting protein DprA [Synergistaceae bacterium]|nr:DNA-protecting protein DprA [Synergistaceae bacterium]
MDEVLKALLLLNKAGLDVRAWEKIIAKKMSPEMLWKSSIEKVKELGFTESALTKIREDEKRGWAEREIEKSQKLGIKITTFLDNNYPETLSVLKDAPLLLYWKGHTTNISFKTIGVVGTRKSTVYGQRIAERIGMCSAQANISLISGGASGIDEFAHSGVCKINGRTFAILGNGVDIDYPRSNSELFARIREKGALISEFPLGTKGEPWRFPRRNRIVAALSEKLIVVEAPIKSGAMITARIAIDLGKEVWAVPGPINMQVSEGCNRLIFDGAYPYINDDVFWGIQEHFESVSNVSDKLKKINIESLSSEEITVVHFLLRSGGHTIDNIANEVKMDAANVLKTIAILSAKEIVYTSAPGRYSVNI